MSSWIKCVVLAGVVWGVQGTLAGWAAGNDPAAKTSKEAPAASSESMDKVLATLKKQREEAATVYANDDLKLAALDRQILLLKAQMAARENDVDAKQTAEELAKAVKQGVDLAQEETATEKAAGQEIRNTKVTVAFKDQPLEKILDVLKDQAHCNLAVNWDALRQINIGSKTAVSVQLTKVDFTRALQEVLANASQTIADPSFQLDYVIDKGVVSISTRQDLQGPVYQRVRLYNVNDLLAVPNAGSLTRAEKQEAFAERSKELQEIIKNSIDIDSWRDNQGLVGTIQEFDGVLIINQTIRAHQDVASLLAELRIVRAAALNTAKKESPR